MDTLLSDDPYTCGIGKGRQARKLCIKGFFDKDIQTLVFLLGTSCVSPDVVLMHVPLDPYSWIYYNSYDILYALNFVAGGRGTSQWWRLRPH